MGAIENISPSSKGPYNTSSHLTYPALTPPYRNEMDSTPSSQKHSFSGGSMNLHSCRVPARKQVISPNSLHSSVGDEVAGDGVSGVVFNAAAAAAGVTPTKYVIVTKANEEEVKDFMVAFVDGNTVLGTLLVCSLVACGNDIVHKEATKQSRKVNSE